MPRTFRSLVTKAGLAASALSMAVVFCAGLMSLFVARDGILKAINNEMDNRADLISLHISSSLENLVGDLSGMARNALMGNALADSKGRDNYLRPYLNSSNTISGIPMRIVLSDYAGRLLASNQTVVPSEYDPELSKRVVESGVPQISLRNEQGQVLLAMAWPVLYANTGLPEGALSYTFDFDQILHGVFMEKKGPSAFRIFCSTPEGKHLFSLTHGAEPPEESLSLRSAIEMPNILKHWSMQVEVWTDKTRYTNEVWRLIIGYTVIGLLGMVLLIPTGVLVVRRLLRRLRELEAVACKVVETRSLEHGFSEQGGDEIASLGKSFNIMLNDLRQAQQELKSEANKEIRVHSERLRRVLAETAEGYARIDVDNRVVLEVNEAFCHMAGVSCKLWEGQPPPDFLRVFVERAESARSVASWTDEVRVEDVDGTTRMFLLHASLDIDQEGNKQLIVFVTDMTGLRTAEQELQRGNVKLSETVALLENRDRELTALNKMNELLLAIKSREEAYQIIGRKGAKIFPGASGALAILQADGETLDVMAAWGRERVCQESFTVLDCWGMRQGRIVESNEQSAVACAHLCEHISTTHVCIPLMVKGKTLGLLWSEVRQDGAQAAPGQREILISFSEAIKMSLSNLDLREALHYQATRDPLTGLYNRRHFNETLEIEIAKADRLGAPLSVAAFDLDRFKSVNDQYGHEAGDVVLIRFAALLQEKSRKSDAAFRIGGEEFVLLLPGTDVNGAVRCVENIRTSLERTRIKFLGAVTIAVTVSCGVAQLPEHGKDGKSLLRAADDALYKAKEQGRNRIVVAELAPEQGEGAAESPETGA
jgi:diguanylate cyclase (GGDEF)-like protein/PAS domain S-box-containing protein